MSFYRTKPGILL